MLKKRSLRFLIIAQALLLALSLRSLDPMPAAQAAFGDRITVSGSQFMAGGQRIWIIVENAESGQLTWSRIQQLAAKSARAVHTNSPILFTVGLAMPKYQSSTLGFGDVMSNSALRGFVNDPLVFLDYRQTHFYDWMTPIWGNTLYMTPAGHGFDTSKPWVIGEFPAMGTAGHTTSQDYESAFNTGWQGAMAWTSNGVDSNGSLTQLGPATSTFRNSHPNLVFPGGQPSPTFTHTRTPTRTGTPTQGPTNTPTRTTTPTGTACTNPVLQAENASFGGGATADSNNAGFNGTGFINFPASGGFVQFTNVNGGAGGSTTVRIRYALGASASRSGQLTVNGANRNITFATTGSWTTWVLQNVSVPLNAGATNIIHFQSSGQDLGNLDQIEMLICGTVTPTSMPTHTATSTVMPTTGPTSTPTRTPMPGSGVCSPVTATIAAPFTFDGAGTFCWQTSSLGSFVNSWELARLTINGVDFSNRWAASSSYPPPINGFWYISYTGNFAWSHFETK